MRTFYDGLKTVAVTSGPLLIAMAGDSAMMIFDRICLAAYSKDTLAASGPAVFTSHTVIAFFSGFVFSMQPRLVQAYVRDPDESGFDDEAARTFFITGVSALLLITLCPLLIAISSFSGRPAEILNLEAEYIWWSAAFGAAMTLNTAGACYFSARAKTSFVMLVNMLGQAIAISSTYCLVFGKFGMPELGMAGSAIGTLLGTASITISYAFLIPRSVYVKLKSLIIRSSLGALSLKRRLKIGAALGLSDSADELGHVTTLWIVGLLGTSILAANNFGIIINYLSIIPIVGIGDGMNVLAARARETRDAKQLVLMLTASIFLAFLVVCFVYLAVNNYGDEILILLNIDSYGNNVIEQSKLTMHVVFLYAIGFSVSYICARTLQALGQNSYVLLSRLVVTFGISTPIVFSIVTTRFLDPYTLQAVWFTVSTFEGVFGVVLLLKILKLTRGERRHVGDHTEAPSW